MSTLYELTGERLALQRKLESMNLDDETIADTLEGYASEIEEKIIHYGYVIQNRRSFISQMDIEIERLNARRTSEVTKLQKIEDWLITNMQAANIGDVECPSFKVRVKFNPESVSVIDKDLIPAAYMRQPDVKTPPLEPNKTLIKEAIKSGLEVAGCALNRTAKLEIK